jgi:membrane protein YqaA with SNARE-associated domain
MLKGLLYQYLKSAQDKGALWVAVVAIALIGTATATLPVTALAFVSTVLSRGKWIKSTLFCTAGSTVGALLLLMVAHHLGWIGIYEHFPEMTTHPEWFKVMQWVQNFGPVALFLISISPLPQTPALIFFGIVRHDYFAVLLALGCGKFIKYSVVTFASKKLHWKEHAI